MVIGSFCLAWEWSKYIRKDLMLYQYLNGINLREYFRQTLNLSSMNLWTLVRSSRIESLVENMIKWFTSQIPLSNKRKQSRYWGWHVMVICLKTIITSDVVQKILQPQLQLDFIIQLLSFVAKCKSFHALHLIHALIFKSFFFNNNFNNKFRICDL